VARAELPRATNALDVVYVMTLRTHRYALACVVARSEERNDARDSPRKKTIGGL
jgi:hypothetical protein